jgi:asparagine synthetase B (glutamine-hydrolysing)
MSSYLALRYVADEQGEWVSGVGPELAQIEPQALLKIKTGSEVLKKLRGIVEAACRNERVGILLSSGMDSAIIAAFVPPGTPAYTVRFVAEGFVDEVGGARRVAERLEFEHTVVDVTWKDYQASLDPLMRRKRAPLHPVEVGLYKAARVAAHDGVKMLLVGNGADSTFGGLDKLLSRDWTFAEFVRRYTFLDPARVLRQPVSMVDVFEPYRRGDGIDVVGFLKVVHGLGIVQMFENAVGAAGCAMIAPFEQLVLDTPLDMQRIRSGESKYILREVYSALYPNLDVPEKIAFARPVTQWLRDWPGPTRAEFLDNLDMTAFTGEQRWQLYCLDRFLRLLDEWMV